MTSAFRFIHTSDLHLEQPLHGVGEIPDHLRDVFLDAGYSAAERVFTAAVEHQVDFIVISGDFMQPQQTGPRGFEFITQQFRRLDAAGIQIYWSVGKSDQNWPASFTFPKNLEIFADRNVECRTYRRDDKPIAVIQGRASNGSDQFSFREFDADGALPTVVSVFGRPTGRAMGASEVAYWALGGRHQEENVQDNETIAYAGSPQGRTPDEPGPHGCRLVAIDAKGEVEIHPIVCDVVRWCHESFELTDEMDEAGLMRWLRERAHRILESASGRPVIIDWQVVDGDESTDTRSDQLASRLREGELAADILQALRHEFGTSMPCVWHSGMEVVPPRQHPSGWYEEDTVLGDLLRTVQQFQADEHLLLPIEELPSDASLSEDVAQLLKASTQEDRELILRRIAALGVDLLRGDRVLAEESDSRNDASMLSGGL